MMLAHFLRAGLPVLLAGTFGLQLAHADIYTWIDAAGRVNLSNLAPPEGVRVTRVVRETAPRSVTRDDAVRDAARQAEVQALAERVRQLQEEVELARRYTPPQVEYRPLPTAPAMQYVSDTAPAPVQYGVNVSPPATSGCYFSWMDCGLWWGPSIYPANVIVLRTPNFRRVHPVHGGRHFVPPQPVHAPGGFRRR